jgi:hypothetical protein
MGALTQARRDSLCAFHIDVRKNDDITLIDELLRRCRPNPACGSREKYHLRLMSSFCQFETPANISIQAPRFSLVHVAPLRQ